jgi:hypothetical protein
MTAPVLTGPNLAVLDGLLVEALAELRSARARCVRHSGGDALAAQERAESNLNALLDYRTAVASRRRPAP